MTQPSVHIQIAPISVPSTPSWPGEVAVLAHVFNRFDLQKAIEQRVRFARARMGDYEVIDFVVMLIGYAVSGEPTLQAFYQRLLPFASSFMALFGRANLPHPATLSRLLAALHQTPVEALRTLFQEDLVARSVFASPPSGVWDRQGTHWTVVDVDGTKKAARQRALPQTPELPAPHRRFDQVCAPAYLGRKRGEVGRTRTTILQAHTHQSTRTTILAQASPVSSSFQPIRLNWPRRALRCPAPSPMATLQTCWIAATLMPPWLRCYALASMP